MAATTAAAASTGCLGGAASMALVGVGMLICRGSSGCGVAESFALLVVAELGVDSWCSMLSVREMSFRYSVGISSWREQFNRSIIIYL